MWTEWQTHGPDNIYIESSLAQRDRKYKNSKYESSKHRWESTMIHLILILNGANINKIK